MRIVQLSGLNPILGAVQIKSFEQRKAYRLAKLQKALSNLPVNSFAAHLIRNEIKRLNNTAESQPQGSIREYAQLLQDRLKMYKDRKGLSWLINKELKMISENRFKGSTATGKMFGDIGSIGRRKKRKGFFRKIGKGLKNAFKSLKTVALAPARNAFLGILRLNVRGLASKINRAPKDKIFRLWDRLGGKRSSLEKAVSKGAKKKALLGSKATGGTRRKRIRGISAIDDQALSFFNKPIGVQPVQNESAGGSGAGTAAAAAAATAATAAVVANPAGGASVATIIAAAAPVLIAFSKLLKKEGIDTSEGMIDPDTGEVVEAGTGSVLENIASVASQFAGGSQSVENALPTGGYTVADVEEGAVPDAGYPSDDSDINESANARTSVTISPVLIGAAAIGVFLLMKKK